MSAGPLGLPEALALAVTAEAKRLLSPREVSEHAVLPLLAEGDRVVVAADPAATDRAERFLRVRHGLRRIDIRPTTREVFERLLADHFRPFWEDKGWSFPGLPEAPAAPGGGWEVPVEAAPESGPTPRSVPSSGPPPARGPSRAPVPGSSPARVPGPAAAPIPGPASSAAGTGPAEPPDHPVVLLVEASPDRRLSLGALLSEAGYEVRFAAGRDEVERELGRAPPALLALRRDGPVSPEEALPLVRATRGRTELRIVDEPAHAILGGGGDERLPRFLYDISRFVVGVVATAGGGRMEGTETRARYAERAARIIRLGRGEIEGIRLAAVLGDLEAHLARLRGHDVAEGGEGLLAPLLDPTRTPYPLGEVLDARAERWDGAGPRGLAGEVIPLGARLLAAIDAFLGMREAGTDRGEIESRLRERSGADLDPRVVEAVLRADRAESLVDQLGQATERDRVLLVEPDAVTASLLEMRLANAGFDVDVHRDGNSALEAVGRTAPAAVLSEVAVPGVDGFSMLLRLRREEATSEIPFVFVSERTDRGATMRGLELGADDYLAKPVDLDLLVAKVRALVRKTRARRPAAAAAPAGVSGDLAEMELVDLLQVLAASGRTAVIRLDGGFGPQGELALEQGRLVDARTACVEGLAAFYGLLARTAGRFTVESRSSGHRTIDEPLEALLLEACRLRDEASRGLDA